MIEGNLATRSIKITIQFYTVLSEIVPSIMRDVVIPLQRLQTSAGAKLEILQFQLLQNWGFRNK